jgi:hypothetical protein
MTDPYPPPAGLSEASEALWRDLVPSRGKSAARRALIAEALRARDRADEFRALIATQGATTTTKTTGALHLNPLVKAEQEARGMFARILLGLHLEWDPSLDGRSS